MRHRAPLNFTLNTCPTRFSRENNNIFVCQTRKKIFTPRRAVDRNFSLKRRQNNLLAKSYFLPRAGNDPPSPLMLNR